jgi:cation diffusion facilitator CzcD-associated flavoprotein CzcO
MNAEELDVLVVGAGLSGIAAGYHLQTTCPGRSWAIWEARDAIGGTWDLFRYPGIRSDSDMYTLGYSFRPWSEQKAIADGPSILNYVRETAAEFGIDQLIRYQTKVVSASWSSADARWTVTAESGSTGDSVVVRCKWLMMCTGYYDYDGGYTPDFAGMDEFTGRVVHPQKWPEDLDVEGKSVVVIGSGATAVTLVPELSRTAAHVVMLQRSPSYVISMPSVDPAAQRLRALLPERLAYDAVRWKNILFASTTYQICRRFPTAARRFIKNQARENLGDSVDVEPHFSPTYNPWEERMCLVPDGDLFEALKSGRAEMVTDHVARFTETGIQLKSGKELAADIVVTATGLRLKFLAGLEVMVDGESIDASELLVYNGVMLSGVPNLAMTFGYTNASWTLKCDLSCAWVARMLNYMDARGHRVVTPVPDGAVRPEPLVDFSSGYFKRAAARLPHQGNRAPWRVYQNYFLDLAMFRLKSMAGEGLQFR